MFLPPLIRGAARVTLRGGALAAAVAVILNMGFWTRNLVSFGAPLGPREWIAGHTHILVDPRAWLPEASKHIGLNFTSVLPAANDAVGRAVGAVHSLFGVGMQGFGAFPWWNWNHEDLAPNPLHMAMLLLTVLILILRREPNERLSRRFALTLCASFLMLPLIFSFNIYVVRFHLATLVIGGALFGVLVDSLRLRRGMIGILALLVVSAGPWLLMNRTRSLFAWVPHTYISDSILTAPQERVLFANWHGKREPYLDAVAAVKAGGCEQIGLRIDSSDLEYPIWWLLDAPQSGYHIEATETTPALARYLDPDFKPCAILCTVCGERESLYGLPRIGVYGDDMALFTGPNYHPDLAP
jgi:hypothetical protein